MSKPRSKSGLDWATFGGLVVGLGGLVGGLVLEGGSLRDIQQFTAAIIVLGGTFGAVLVNTPMATVRGACRRLKGVLFEPARRNGRLLEELTAFALQARRNGLISLEADAENASHPFLRKALALGIDGTDEEALRNMMELQIDIEEQDALAEAKVFEAAGGYAPTIGIIGAVMGLIQVMKNLEDIKEVGHGIAVAFVATVYGVALANLVFLPAANKIKARIRAELCEKEMILEGVKAIVTGQNPQLLRRKLEPYCQPAEVPQRPAGSMAKAA